MNKKHFLFELGTEEIPAGYIGNAIQKFEELITQSLSENKLSYEQILTYTTPRRMAILVKDLQIQQADEIIEKTGPAKKIAMDDNGQLTKPGLGFVQGAKARPEDVFIKETPKGEYIAVKVEIKGKSVQDLLPEMLKNAIDKIYFPKSMRWGSLNIPFARPIRWIIALLDQEIIPFEYAGIKASNISQGNRFYQLESNTLISNPDQYLTQLRKVFVIADREERKGLISEQMTSLYKDSRFKIQEDQRLLDQVTDLVEYPTAVIASFEAKYLRLPEKIITSTLTQNQKYFAVLDENNQLTNYFVFISNGNPEHSDIIRTGNEKVVRARLEDAEFYYDEDLKKRLEYYVQKLDSVVFQAKLGTLLEKTERIKAISNYLCDQLNVDELSRKQIVRAAHLCKADLVTLMLGEKEFTKLQGYIGMNYALHSQEEEVVAQAIYEHYMPRGQNDQLPANSISAIVAIADKIDTVCGIIGVDLIPTGSNDPFALRRAANGIVQIAEKYQMDFNINELIDFAYTQLKEKLQSETHNLDVVKDFIKQRVRWLMEQNGFEYDLIDSLNHVEWNSLLDIKTRLSDLKAVKQKDDFIKLVLGFKRVSNIIEKSKTNSLFNETLLQEDAEKALYENFVILQKSLTEKLQSKAYHLALNEILPFNSHIDHFFDCVLVNCEDIQIKENRYALLRMIRMLFLQIADISKIVTE